MARHTKDQGITIGVDIMDMSISWECSIYQKFATFTVLLSFVFSVKSDCICVMGAQPSLLLCVHVSEQMYSVI